MQASRGSWTLKMVGCGTPYGVCGERANKVAFTELTKGKAFEVALDFKTTRTFGLGMEGVFRLVAGLSKRALVQLMKQLDFQMPQHRDI